MLIAEVIIALFVNDDFVRPYVGDVLVVVLITCFIRIFVPAKIEWLALYVFLFALLIEIGQHYNLVARLGLAHSRFFAILLGRTFSFADILCYAIGAALCFGLQRLLCACDAA